MYDWPTVDCARFTGTLEEHNEDQVQTENVDMVAS